MLEPDGGPAFPRPASQGNNYLTGEEDVVVDPQRGMSLRDYFAAAAMQGFLARAGGPTSPELLAKSSYFVAEAMLAMRDKL